MKKRYFFSFSFYKANHITVPGQPSQPVRGMESVILDIAPIQNTVDLRSIEGYNIKRKKRRHIFCSS